MAPGRPGLNTPPVHAPVEEGSRTARESATIPGMHTLNKEQNTTEHAVIRK